MFCSKRVPQIILVHHIDKVWTSLQLLPSHSLLIQILYYSHTNNFIASLGNMSASAPLFKYLASPLVFFFYDLLIHSTIIYCLLGSILDAGEYSSQRFFLGQFRTYPCWWNQCCVFLVCFWGVFLATPHGMWDLSSPTRDQTCAPCIGSAES